MKRQRVPMFQAGSRVIVTLGPGAVGGRVDMASVKLGSLFITLDTGTVLKILGLPRPKQPTAVHNKPAVGS